VVSVTPRPLSTLGKDPVPIVQEVGWAPGLVWTGADNLASTGIRSPNRPVHSSVAIPTELPGLPFDRYKASKYIAHLHFRKTTFEGFRSFPQCYFYKFRTGVYREVSFI
jgi:hypothetical protein